MPPPFSASALAAYRALRSSLRATDIDDRVLVSAFSTEFKRLLCRGERRERKERQEAAERCSTAAAAASVTSTSTTKPSLPSKTSALVRDFALLLSAVKHQRDLLLSYDIGVDRDARQMETVRRTAERCGLRLPEEAREEGEGGGAAAGGR